jgi:hypothetical protein
MATFGVRRRDALSSPNAEANPPKSVAKSRAAPHSTLMRVSSTRSETRVQSQAEYPMSSLGRPTEIMSESGHCAEYSGSQASPNRSLPHPTKSEYAAAVTRRALALASLPLFLSATWCSLSESGLADATTADVMAPDVGTDVIDASSDAFIDVAEEPEAAPVPSPLAPDQVPTLELWLRSDTLTTDDAGTTVLSWPDKSSKNDSNRNANALAGNEPQLVADAGYGVPVVSFFGSSYLQTGTWAGAPFAQPATIFVVGDGAHYFVDSLNAAGQFAVLSIGGDLSLYAGTYVLKGGSTAGKGAIVGIFDGINSVLYNSTNSPVTGSCGPNSFSGLTIGCYAGKGSQFTLDGNIAEVAVWSRRLTSFEVKCLNLYATQRYGVTITP